MKNTSSNFQTLEWAARGVVAALFLGLLEMLMVLSITPEMVGDLGLTSGVFLRGTGVLMAPVVMVAVLVGLSKPAWQRLSVPSVTLQCVVWSTLIPAVVGVRIIDRYLILQTLEFHDELRRVVDFAALSWGVVTIVFGGIGGRWFGRRLEGRVAASTLLGVSTLTLLIYAIWVLHRGLLVVHDHRVAPFFAPAACLLAVISIALLVHRVQRKHAWRLMGVGALLLLGLFVGPGSSPGTNYLSYARLGTPRTLMRIGRGVLDWDGDGASPTWLGGADCAPSDPEIGPMRREIPGDGIDQDCVGGDAAKSKPVTNPQPGPWASCLADLEGQPINVVVLTMDAARADAIGPKLTPALGPLFHEGAWFHRAYSPSSHTAESLPALFTGLMPSDLGAPDLFARGGALPHITTLVEALKRRGYRTHGLLTIDTGPYRHGFDHLGGGRLDPPPVGESRAGYDASALADQAIDFLEQEASGPFFLWMHILDSHAPYVPISRGAMPRPEAGDYGRAVAYSTFHVRRVIDAVRRTAGANTVVVFTSDHGEDLDQRGRQGHGPDLYQGSVHVPLGLLVPGCPAAQIEQPVSVIDIVPTLARLTGLFKPKWSLVSAIGGSPRPTSVVSEVYMLGQMRRVLIDARHALHIDVRNGGRLLFDLIDDPGETLDLYGDDEALTAKMEAAYQAWLDRPLP